MSWVLLKSTVLRAARYSQQQQLLDLEFRSGAIYRYSHFPPNQYVIFWPPTPMANTSITIF
jgi:hypothetical protein